MRPQGYAQAFDSPRARVLCFPRLPLPHARRKEVNLLKRITRIALLVIALTTSTFSCFAQTGTSSATPPPAAEYNPKAWKEFSSAEGRFSVLLPSVPTERVELHDSPVGKLEVHNFTLRTFAEYGVMYVEYPPNIEEEGNVRAFLDNIRDGGVRRVKGTVLEEKDISLGGHPGRYMLVRIGDGYTLRAKTFVVKNRLYQVIIITRDKDAPEGIIKFHEETAAKFLDSFKLVSGVAETPHPVVRGPSPPAAGMEDGASRTAKVDGELDRLLKSLKDKGELVVGVCAEGDECQPLPDIEGFKAEDRDKVVVIKVVNKPQPAYPPIAKAARAQGTVTVQVLVDEEGKVIAAQAVSGHPLLQAAAVKAARDARFSPILLGTKPVKVSGVITYNFVLQ